jgi:hypothetical protein
MGCIVSAVGGDVSGFPPTVAKGNIRNSPVFISRDELNWAFCRKSDIKEASWKCRLCPRRLARMICATILDPTFQNC